MRKRAPGAKPLIAAILPDHHLTFESNEPPGRSDAFFANVRPRIAASVPGAVYEIDAATLEALDAYEDVPLGVYERATIAVRCADGRRAGAIVYRMPFKMEKMRLGPPSRSQLDQIRSGYAEWGLELRFLEAALESVKSINFTIS